MKRLTNPTCEMITTSVYDAPQLKTMEVFVERGFANSTIIDDMFTDNGSWE